MSGWLSRMWQGAFGARPRPVPRSAEHRAPPAPPEIIEQLEAVPALAALPVFDGDVAQRLTTRIKTLMQTGEHPGDKMLLSLLLRAVKNDGADLPALPKEIINIQRLLGATEIDINKLSQAIQREPTVAAKFLAVANSPFYGGRYNVSSVHHAVVRLGLSNTNMLITAIFARAKVFRIKAHEAEAARLYEHALSSAAIAQLLAEQTDQAEQDAFVGGLFHDLGRVFVLSTAGNVNAKTKKKAERTEPPRPEMLAEATQALDAGFSAMIVESWGYSKDIVDALAQHHDPVCAERDDVLSFPQPHERLAYVIAASDCLARGFAEEDEEALMAARQILDALDVELDDDLCERARATVDAFMAEVGAKSAA